MASPVGAILFLHPITLPISHSPFSTSISHFHFPLPFTTSIYHSHLPLPRLLLDAAALSSMQGLSRSGNFSAQTSASLHPPASLRLRVLPFTRTWSSTVCAEEFPTPLEMSPWIASAQTDANLSAHLHRLPTPPPYLRRMRLSPGWGAGVGCWI